LKTHSGAQVSIRQRMTLQKGLGGSPGAWGAQRVPWGMGALGRLGGSQHIMGASFGHTVALLAHSVFEQVSRNRHFSVINSDHVCVYWLVSKSLSPGRQGDIATLSNISEFEAAWKGIFLVVAVEELLTFQITEDG